MTQAHVGPDLDLSALSRINHLAFSEANSQGVKAALKQAYSKDLKTQKQAGDAYIDWLAFELMTRGDINKDQVLDRQEQEAMVPQIPDAIAAFHTSAKDFLETRAKTFTDTMIKFQFKGTLDLMQAALDYDTQDNPVLKGVNQENLRAFTKFIEEAIQANEAWAVQGDMQTGLVAFSASRIGKVPLDHFSRSVLQMNEVLSGKDWPEKLFQWATDQKCQKKLRLAKETFTLLAQYTRGSHPKIYDKAVKESNELFDLLNAGYAFWVDNLGPSEFMPRWLYDYLKPEPWNGKTYWVFNPFT